MFHFVNSIYVNNLIICEAKLFKNGSFFITIRNKHIKDRYRFELSIFDIKLPIK